jgi:hypothetical protein
MNRLAIVRLISVMAGAAVLFGLERGLGVQLYFAIPAATVVYLAIKVGLGLLWGVGDKVT